MALPRSLPLAEAVAAAGWWPRLITAVSAFFSAFRHPPFFWLSLQLIFYATEGIVQGLFYLYWFEDVIAPNFTFGGAHITSSTVTALSIVGMLGQAGGLVCAPLGAYFGARFERRKVLFVGSAVAVLIPVINAALPTFEWVVLTALLNCVLTGIRGPVGAAFMADCLPVDTSRSGKGDSGTGLTAVSPAKNMNFLQIVPRFPQVILPPVLGAVFSIWGTSARTYTWMFIAAAILQTIGTLIFLKIDPSATAGSVAGAQDRRAMMDSRLVLGERGEGILGSLGRRSRNTVPVGAWLCDRIIFGKQQGD